VADLLAVKDAALEQVGLMDPLHTVSVEPIERLIDEHLRVTGSWIDMVSRGERAPAIAAASNESSLARRDALRKAFADVLEQAVAIQQEARLDLYDALMINRVAVHLLALATVLSPP